MEQQARHLYPDISMLTFDQEMYQVKLCISNEELLISISKLRVLYAKLCISISKLCVSNANLLMSISKLRISYAELRVSISKLRILYAELRISISKLCNPVYGQQELFYKAFSLQFPVHYIFTSK